MGGKYKNCLQMQKTRSAEVQGGRGEGNVVRRMGTQQQLAEYFYYQHKTSVNLRK